MSHRDISIRAFFDVEYIVFCVHAQKYTLENMVRHTYADTCVYLHLYAEHTPALLRRVAVAFLIGSGPVPQKEPSR